MPDSAQERKTGICRFHFRRRRAERDMKTGIMNFTKNLGMLVLAVYLISCGHLDSELQKAEASGTCASLISNREGGRGDRSLI